MYYAVNEIEFLNENKEFIENFRVMVIEAVKRSKSNLTFSNYPISPFVKAPGDIAVWYSVISTEFFEKGKQNVLRNLSPGSNYLLDFCETLGYPFPKEKLTEMCKVYSAFIWMMRNEYDNKNWRSLMRAQYQNYIIVDEKYVFLDGENLDLPKPTLPEFGLSFEQLFTLSKLVDRQKSHNSFVFKLPIEKSYPEISNNYCYSKDVAIKYVPVCSTTLRPYYIDKETKMVWSNCAERYYKGEVKKLISNFRYFEKFVEEKKKFPSKSELILFMFEKKNRATENRYDTLPLKIQEIVDYSFVAYQKVLGENFGSVSVELFIQTIKLGQNIEDRLILESKEENN